jgi:RNA polymerase sigma factor (sigma-70 family)
LKFLKLFRAGSVDEHNEADLLLAYRRKGDLRMLGRLYQPYMELVFSVSYKYLRDEDESKDAVMQIFEKLVTDLRTHEVLNLKSWLHRLTINFCLMQIRSRRVFADMDDLVEAAHFVDYPDNGQAELDLDRNLTELGKCMQALNEEQRVSISLFFEQEKCYREISEETGFEVNKVKSYIQNGKRNLKICMDKNGSR